ncbi:hypothetical protein D3C72_2094090 [compost metagenome]
MAQRRRQLAVFEIEGHALDPDAVEIALEHGRETEVPDRGDDDQSFRRLQPLDIGFHQDGVFRIVVIDGAVMGGEDGIEAFFVEIAAIDLVAGLGQALAGLAIKCPAIAFVERMGM